MSYQRSMKLECVARETLGRGQLFFIFSENVGGVQQYHRYTTAPDAKSDGSCVGGITPRMKRLVADLVPNPPPPMDGSRFISHETILYMHEGHFRPKDFAVGQMYDVNAHPVDKCLQEYVAPSYTPPPAVAYLHRA